MANVGPLLVSTRRMYICRKEKKKVFIIIVSSAGSALSNQLVALGVSISCFFLFGRRGGKGPVRGLLRGNQLVAQMLDARWGDFK